MKDCQDKERHKRYATSVSLAALQLKAKRQVYTMLSGHTLSKLHGEGYDFSELREYQIGDDIRKINWVITAKLGKPYIKELHTNRELSVVAVCLMDGSLYFNQTNAKQKKMTEIATLLGYATQQSSDLFTGIAYTHKQTLSSPPSKQIYHIEQFSKTVYEAKVLHSKIDPNAAIKDLFKRIHKPSLVFVIGDFLEKVDLSILSQKHEVIAVIVREREEEALKKLGEVALSDPRSVLKLDTYFAQKNIDQYKKRLAAHDLALLEHFTRYNIRFVKIFTNEEAAAKLMQLFV